MQNLRQSPLNQAFPTFFIVRLRVKKRVILLGNLRKNTDEVIGVLPGEVPNYEQLWIINQESG